MPAVLKVARTSTSAEYARSAASPIHHALRRFIVVSCGCKGCSCANSKKVYGSRAFAGGLTDRAVWRGSDFCTSVTRLRGRPGKLAFGH